MDRVITEHVGPADSVHAPTVESSKSAVSWGAIIAGAVVAASVSLVLLALASGLGLALVSPWPSTGASPKTFSITTAIALIVVQWLASGVGGYVTGRLRTKWVGTHTHEVFFRDTAHGFITWALATALVASLLASAVSSLVGAGARAATAATAAAAGGATQSGLVSPYNVDMLFRPAQPDANTPSGTADARAEATRILTESLSSADVPAADRTYLAQLVAARTGTSEDDARKRVDDVISRVQADETKARQAADAARKAGAAASIYTALSMVIGAFIASVAAALGGRWRDQYP
jgi:hypothetical protein